MPGLPPDLHRRLCDALIASGYCDSDDALRAVCVDARVAPWRHDLPEATTPKRRAEAVVAALWEQRAESGENALALLLHTLSGRFESDMRRQTLADLADACETATPWTGIDAASLAYARLHTLPAPPADFTGREDELAQLLQAVETGERADAAYRHAEHYLQVLWKADALYKQGNEGIVAALALYDRESHNIHAGFAWASFPPSVPPGGGEVKEGKTPASPPVGGTERGRAALCSAYPDAGVYILTLRLHPREKIRWLEAALRAARALGRRDAEGVHLGNLGNAYAALGDARRAIEYHEQALVIDREIGDRRWEEAGLSNLAQAYLALNNVSKARELYEQALHIGKEIGAKQYVVRHLAGLAFVAFLQEDDVAVETYSREAHTICEEIGDLAGLIGVLFVQGMLAYVQYQQFPEVN
ncbi:MAG: tetratricopeptide repeat protein [Anaerolineae bacterium]